MQPSSYEVTEYTFGTLYRHLQSAQSYLGPTNFYRFLFSQIAFAHGVFCCPNRFFCRRGNDKERRRDLAALARMCLCVALLNTLSVTKTEFTYNERQKRPCVRAVLVLIFTDRRLCRFYAFAQVFFVVSASISKSIM